jgi:hypothetical protein
LCSACKRHTPIYVFFTPLTSAWSAKHHFLDAIDESITPLSCHWPHAFVMAEATIEVCSLTQY